MFANAYQNGPYLEIWDSKSNPDKKLFQQQLFRFTPNTIVKYFDKDCKCYLYNIQGQNCKLTLPADDSRCLALHQQYLILQIYIPSGSEWSMDLGLTDLTATKRRISLTTTHGKPQTKYFSLRYPIDYLRKGEWLYLVIDIFSFMSAWKDQVYRTLDHITINPTCRLRRIFTMRSDNQLQIPKNYWFPQQIPQTFQLIHYDQQVKINHLGMYKLLNNDSQYPNTVKKQKSLPNQSKIIPSQRKRLAQSYLPQINNRDNDSVKHYSASNKPNIGIKSTKGLLKSELAIQKSKLRLNQLQKQQEQILAHSRCIVQTKDITLSPQFKASSQKNLTNRSRIPKLQISFKEDIALNVTPQLYKHHGQLQHSKLELDCSQEPIEEDKWSEQDSRKRNNPTPYSSLVSTPITQAIQSFTGNFPSTTITKQNKAQVIIQKKQHEIQLQLIYDQMVGCYYHPQTNTYYELKK